SARVVDVEGGERLSAAGRVRVDAVPQRGRELSGPVQGLRDFGGTVRPIRLGPASPALRTSKRTGPPKATSQDGQRIPSPRRKSNSTWCPTFRNTLSQCLPFQTLIERPRPRSPS